MAVIDLEGCSPLQPETNKAPTLGAYSPDKHSFDHPARRRGTGRPPGLDQASMAVIDLEGCSPLQPETNKAPTLGASSPDKHSFDHPTRRRGTGRPRSLNQASMAVIDLEGCSPFSRQPIKPQHWAHTLPTNTASIAQRGAEGPDALQVSIKLQWPLLIWRAAVPCSRKPIKPQHWAHTLPTNTASITQRGAEGPDALQVSTKLPWS